MTSHNPANGIADDVSARSAAQRTVAVRRDRRAKSPVSAILGTRRAPRAYIRAIGSCRVLYVLEFFRCR